ncbi:MAG TPA: DUF1320 family protein [Chitinophagales bacterium]|nr:DUF1320 family protein [Chitinophagales bacterium]
MYIQKNDYKSRISTELLNLILTRILQDEPGIDEVVILSDISKTAEDIITTYTCKLYDIIPEFAKSGTTRNYQILNWAINIAMYIVYQRIEDYDVPAKVVKNHDDTIETLENVSKGKFDLNLPVAPIIEGSGATDETGTGLRRFGSKKPRSHEI